MNDDMFINDDDGLPPSPSRDDSDMYPDYGQRDDDAIPRGNFVENAQVKATAERWRRSRKRRRAVRSLLIVVVVLVAIGSIPTLLSSEDGLTVGWYCSDPDDTPEGYSERVAAGLSQVADAVGWCIDDDESIIN